MLQRPSSVSSLMSTLGDLLSPAARSAALDELERSGLLDGPSASAWRTELGRPLYAREYASGLLSRELVKLRAVVEDIGGELSRTKTTNILSNVLSTLVAGGRTDLIAADRIGDFRVLDFGAGVWSSLSASLVLFANGYKTADAFEPFPIDPDMVADGVFATIRHLAEFPRELTPLGATPDAVRRRIAGLDLENLRARLARLADGEVSVVDLGGVALRRDLAEVADGYYDVIFSNSVFEHVDDVPGSLARQRKMLSDQGALAHTIDFSDHRALSPIRTESDVFQLYYDGVLEEINGLRPSRFEALFREAGLAGVRINRVRAPEGYVRPDRLVPAFADHAIDDLSVVVNSYALRKA